MPSNSRSKKNKSTLSTQAKSRSFHIILSLPLSFDDICEVEQKFSKTEKTSSLAKVPNPIVEQTALDYTNLEPIKENQLSDSQVFNSRYFVDSLAKPVQGEQVPENVSTVCWWDGFAFNGQPIGIPTNYHDKHGQKMRGIFCSPQCAAAAIWNSSAPSHIKWEQYMLLHSYAGWSFNSGQRIKNAPERFTLVPQGGTLTIEEFRELNRRRDKSHRVIYPPCTADTPIFEVNTKDEFASKNRGANVPLEEDRVRAAMEQLSSKNSTQLSMPGKPKKRGKVGKKTLVSLMNLKIKDTPVTATQN